MEKATILWVQDNINGPINGVAKYKDEEVWFSKNESKFHLFKLSNDILNKLTENHKNYCELTGKPLKHGDPTKIKRHKQVVKIPTKPHIKEGENSVEAKLRSLGDSATFYHSVNPLDITGEPLAIIEESDFDNYYVPNKVEFI